ncbi:hypothetical protein LUX29_20605 [Aureimonas altamirensis]|uniref:hypothetical protein n=1 Tax=Aureimonas altamirensis TaxID=370622 RepID=UPI001E5636AE|nr:hypothetical protein [Aureimonas altamirensis]UHD45364.1 hypothetical protein LUX29_20605 [Aureimonas altamirensis]
MTKIATLRNPLAQHVRNFVMHAVLGFSQVQHAAANTVTETAVHYPHSPINGPYVGDGPGPGERFVSDAVKAPIGLGPNPRFTLFADETDELSTMLQGFGNLVDQHIRAPIRAGMLLLVRPDGYVACSTNNVSAIADYLLRISGRA